MAISIASSALMNTCGSAASATLAECQDTLTLWTRMMSSGTLRSRPSRWESWPPQTDTVSDDRLMQILISLAVLLFVSVGSLPLAQVRYPWAKWAKWGAVTVFSIAV